jgi:hypothetical protein
MLLTQETTWKSVNGLSTPIQNWIFDSIKKQVVEEIPKRGQREKLHTLHNAGKKEEQDTSISSHHMVLISG